MTEEQIKHMTERFLAWSLPEGFHPDGGISFVHTANPGTPHEYRVKPTGTNLFDYTQAKAMVEHMVAGLPGAEPSFAGMPIKIDLSLPDNVVVIVNQKGSE